MADEVTGTDGDNLDDLAALEAANALALEGDDATASEDSDAAPVEDGSDAADADKDVQTRIAELEKSYKHVRSYADKTSGENAMLKAKLELLEGQIANGVSGKQAEKEVRDFEKEWREALAETPERAVDLISAVARDQDARFAALLDKKIGELTERLDSQTPEYRANKEVVDGLMSKYRLNRNEALELAKDMGAVKSKGTSQPPRVKSPGLAGAAGGSAAGSQAAKRMAPVDGVFIALAKKAGLTDEQIIQMRREAAEG